jgi:hypothetical protein
MFGGEHREAVLPAGALVQWALGVDRAKVARLTGLGGKGVPALQLAQVVRDDGSGDGQSHQWHPGEAHEATVDVTGVAVLDVLEAALDIGTPVPGDQPIVQTRVSALHQGSSDSGGRDR